MYSHSQKSFTFESYKTIDKWFESYKTIDKCDFTRNGQDSQDSPEWKISRTAVFSTEGRKLNQLQQRLSKNIKL